MAQEIVKYIVKRIFNNSIVQMGEAEQLKHLSERHVSSSAYTQHEKINLYTYSFTKGLREVKGFKADAKYQDDRKTQYFEGNMPMIEDCEYIIIHKKGHLWTDNLGSIRPNEWDNVYMIFAKDVLQIPIESDPEIDLKNLGFSYGKEDGEIIIRKDGIKYELTIYASFSESHYMLMKKIWE